MLAITVATDYMTNVFWEVKAIRLCLIKDNEII